MSDRENEEGRGKLYRLICLFPIAAAIGSWDMLLGDIRGLCGSRFPAYPRVLTNTFRRKARIFCDWADIGQYTQYYYSSLSLKQASGVAISK